MVDTIRYSLIGLEDLALGTGTFQVTLADNSVVAFTKINDSNLPATAGGFIDDYIALLLAGSKQHGCCRLTKSGANLLLSPFNGVGLIINGTVRAQVAAGVTLAPTSLSADTTYFIYAAWSGTAITLEASTTTYATDATTGVTIKSGDSTRTLVGMARTTSGTAWADSVTQRFTLSHFHRRAIGGVNSFTTNRGGIVSTSYVEVHTEIRVEYITWADEAVSVSLAGSMSQATVTQTVASAIGIDGTTASDAMCQATLDTYATSTDFFPVAATLHGTQAEGYHYATLLGKVSGGTGAWLGSAAAGTRSTVTVGVRG